MTNKYRVDRNDSSVSTPCGMNSILYIGDSYGLALGAYERAAPHRNAWGQPDLSYGVSLAEWRPNENEYKVIRWKI